MLNYLNENKKIHKLNKFYINSNQKKFYKHNLLFFFYYKLKYLIFGLVYYFWELCFNFGKIYSLLKLRGVYKNNTALVLGNGPSQELISTNELQEFIKNGGKLFVVNYWFLNKKIRNIVPNFLVLSDSRVVTRNNNKFFKKNNDQLKKYIRKNKDMKIICPIRMEKQIQKIIRPDRIICFCNSELNNFTSNIKPIFPRGYLSMTVYKAIAMAVWFSFKKIFVLGVDNTYPKNIYVDIDNQLYNHEIHAGKTFKETSLVNISEQYSSMSDFLYETSLLFRDAHKLNVNNNVMNLDEHSLTDAFPKIKYYKDILKKIAN